MRINLDVAKFVVFSCLVASSASSASQSSYYESSCDIAGLINTTETMQTYKSERVSCQLNLDRTIYIRVARTLEKDNFEQNVIGLAKYVNWNRYADFEFDAQVYENKYPNKDEKSYRFGLGYRIRYNNFDFALSIKQVNSNIFENSTGLQLKGRYFLTESLYLGFNSLNTSKLQENQISIGWSF